MPANGLPGFNQADENRALPHKFVWQLNTLLATLLQVKFQEASEIPFVTGKFAATVAFIVTIMMYCLACYAEEKVASGYPDFARIVGYYALLFGLLSNALLVRMLVPALGSVILVISGCCFLTLTFCSFDKIIEQLRQATSQFVGKIKRLMSR